MSPARNEPLFDLTVTLASAVVFVTYVLGVFLDPLPMAGVAALLVGGVAVRFAPRGSRLALAVGGALGVLVAGYLVPWAVFEGFLVDGVGATTELYLALLCSLAVLSALFAVVRVVAFRPAARSRQPV